jgi:hypothetical protein
VLLPAFGLEAMPPLDDALVELLHGIEAVGGVAKPGATLTSADDHRA